MQNPRARMWDKIRVVFASQWSYRPRWDVKGAWGYCCFLGPGECHQESWQPQKTCWFVPGIKNGCLHGFQKWTESAGREEKAVLEISQCSQHRRGGTPNTPIQTPQCKNETKKTKPEKSENSKKYLHCFLQGVAGAKKNKQV